MFLKFRFLLLTILSAGLLVGSYPKIDFSFLAFVAFVPLFGVIGRVSSKRAAFGWAYLCGLLFFWGTLYWFVHVTVPGTILLIFYLSLYFGFFGWFCFRYRALGYGRQLILIPAVWTVLEFIRGHFASGFGWVSLGYSQYRVLPVIQIADVTGFYGVSFFVMLVNLGVFLLIRTPRRLGVFLSVAGVTAVVLVYGFYRLNQPLPPEAIKVSVVQGNIRQSLKWRPSTWPRIFEKYLHLTALAAQKDPDVIIWPESAFPGFVWEAPERWEKLKDFAGRMGIPLVAGFVEKTDEEYFNTAGLFFGGQGGLQKYRKIHLVPFGEYIPFREYLPFLSMIVPMSDFSPGREWTVFSLPKDSGEGSGAVSVGGKRFSVLICFEDTVPEMARRFTKEGADFLVNVTNDAWFKDTNAPYLHLQAAVFRTVENRRSMARAANTGLSCLINPRGKILSCVESGDDGDDGDEAGKRTYVTGVAAAKIPLSQRASLYTFLGDIFTYLCFGCILGNEVWGRRKKR